MSSEALTWKLEQDICRCCLSEGSFQSLSETFCHSGQREIYSDMLRDVLDVNLFPVEGPLCTATYTICEGCVLQLRAACNFKKQVLYCEEKFKEMYSKNYIVLSDSKPTVVKEEVQDTCNDDDYFHVSDDEDHDGADDEPAFSFNSDNDDDAVPPAKQPKKFKPKPKEKPQKKAGKSKRRKKPASAEAESEPSAAEPKRKRGDTPKFFLREEDYTKIGDLLICKKCEKSYDKIDSLRFHVKVKHYKIPRYCCPLCQKKFMTMAPLTIHKLDAHGVDDRFKCNACKGTFNTQVQLKRHINNFHMMGEKYKCEFCDYESYSFEGMYKHKFKHKTVKDYHCKFCKKAFLRKTTLVLHERIHTGDRRKVCSVCGQAFVQKASLNYHMTKYHPEVNF